MLALAATVAVDASRSCQTPGGGFAVFVEIVALQAEVLLHNTG
jgi:hypothetical protein